MIRLIHLRRLNRHRLFNLLLIILYRRFNLLSISFLNLFRRCFSIATFSERLKSLRKASGKTQKQMGEMLGLTERTFRQYEAGEVDPPSSKLRKLADFFDVSTDYLLGRTNYSMDKDGHITVRVPSTDFLNPSSNRAEDKNGNKTEG